MSGRKKKNKVRLTDSENYGQSRPENVRDSLKSSENTRINLQLLKMLRKDRSIRYSTPVQRQYATLVTLCVLFNLSLSGCTPTATVTTNSTIEEDCPQHQVIDPALFVIPKSNYADRLQNLWLSDRNATEK